MSMLIGIGVTRGVPPVRGRHPVRARCAKGFGKSHDADEAAEALTRSLSELSKKEGREARSKNLVMGGNTSEAAWRQLDEKVNSYPSQRMFTAIGEGGTEFLDSIVAVVENHVGPVHVECINQKTSSNGKYLSVTVGPVWVQNADQVVSVYTSIKEDERVKWCM